MSFIMVPLYGQLIVYLSSYLPTIVTYKESIRLTPKAHHPQPPPPKIWVNVTVSHDPGSCCVLDPDSGKKKKKKKKKKKRGHHPFGWRRVQLAISRSDFSSSNINSSLGCVDK